MDSSKFLDSMYDEYEKDYELFCKLYGHMETIERARSILCDVVDPEQVSSVASIGTGPGIVDMKLLSTMKNLETYYGTEISPRYFAKLANNLTENGFIGLQLHLSCVNGEKWGGPHSPVDLVLLVQILNYMSDLPGMLRKAESWLRPGGHVAISVLSPKDFFVDANKAFKGHEVFSPTTSIEVKRAAKEVQWTNMKEFEVKTSVEVPKEYEHQVANLTLHKRCTDAETEAFYAWTNETYNNNLLPVVDSWLFWQKPK